MLDKRFNLLLVSVALLVVAVSVVSVNKITDSVFAAPKGISQVKLFQELGSVDVEPTVNAWLASQSNILIDRIEVDTAGAYQVAIGYHPAPSAGSVITRIKLFSGEELGTLNDQEVLVNNFLNSLSSARDVRAVDVAVGTGAFPAVFILYD